MSHSKRYTLTLLLTALLVPPVAMAQNFNWVTNVVTEVGSVVSTAVPILLGVALLVFIWGVVKFMATDDDSARSDGKKKMFWGIVGLFVIVSVWGLVVLMQTLVGIQGRDAIDPPKVPAFR